MISSLNINFIDMMHTLIFFNWISFRKKVFIFNICRISLALSLLFFAGCSSETKKIKNQKQKFEKKTSSKDSLKSVEKQKQSEKTKNPILYMAQQNKLFNSKRWLKSDYDFFNRSNPRKISQYDRVIKKTARRYGFDWRLISAQIYTESNFKNKAKSYVGATGLMQIMPSTAKFMGFDPSTMINPETNIAVGCMYNQRMYNLWGKQTKDYNRLAFAIASYNAGRGRILKSYNTKDSLTTWKKVHKSLPEETQSYVHKIYLKNNFYKKHVLP